jgi:hypothetical protein
MDWAGLGAARNYVCDVLRQGAAEIRERGWVQGRFFHAESGAVDAVQAVGLAAGINVAESHRREQRLPSGACVLLGAALQEASRILGTRALSVWNDGEDMTPERVAEGLERAADLLEAER